jgi:DNA-binding LytR/AlgR family response regulator
MCEVLEDLNPLLFVRIHRSYAINIEHVTLFAGNMIRMDNGIELNIGREYRYNVEEAFVLIGSRKRVKKSSSC